MSSPIPIYNDVTARTLDLLLGQFKGLENWENFITVLTEPMQELEGIFSDLLDDVSLEDAVGAQLDQLGEIIGQLRGTFDDDQYRELLRFGSALNRSAGEPEFLISALLLLTGANKVQYNEVYPAKITLYTDGNNIPNLLLEKMNNLTLGGVKIMYIANSTGEPFTYDSETAEDYGLGFAWVDGSSTILTDNAGEYPWALGT